MNTDNLRPELRCAIEAAQNKKAAGVTLLDLTDLGAFTGYFLICTAYSTPQVDAIADEIEGQLSLLGLRVEHREGRSQSEWVLLDYGGFLVHIFTERARLFYDLERLWRPAKKIVFPDVDPVPLNATGANARAAQHAEEAD